MEKITGADHVLSELENLGLSLKNCCGQGYDNGANMKGQKSGVQARILSKNPLAFLHLVVATTGIYSLVMLQLSVQQENCSLVFYTGPIPYLLSRQIDGLF